VLIRFLVCCLRVINFQMIFQIQLVLKIQNFLFLILIHYLEKNFHGILTLRFLSHFLIRWGFHLHEHFIQRFLSHFHYRFRDFGIRDSLILLILILVLVRCVSFHELCVHFLYVLIVYAHFHVVCVHVLIVYVHVQNALVISLVKIFHQMTSWHLMA